MQETISTKTESKPDAIFVSLSAWLGNTFTVLLKYLCAIRKFAYKILIWPAIILGKYFDGQKYDWNQDDHFGHLVYLVGAWNLIAVLIAMILLVWLILD